MIPQFLEKLFGPSWRTTTAGLVTGIATALIPVLQAGKLSAKRCGSRCRHRLVYVACQG
jgi:hypothetical protein